MTPRKPKQGQSTLGRPTALTEALTETVARMIQSGVPAESAAYLAGIGTSSFYAWRKTGRDELARREAGEPADPKCEPHVIFLMATEAAQARHEANLVGRILEAAADDWKAATWFLTHGTLADRWRPAPARTELSGPDGAPMEHKICLSDAELAALADTITGISPLGA